MLSSIQKKQKTVTCFQALPCSQLVEQHLWREVKVQGKNIQRRSYHSCVLHDQSLYVYGGYDINTGILDDFRRVRLNDGNQPVEWQQLSPQDKEGYPGKRYGHSAICYQQQMVVFGGKVSCLGNTNQLNVYSFDQEKWLVVKPTGIVVPPMDEHSAVVWRDSMIVFGGFLGGKIGKYSNSVYSLDLQRLQWSELGVYGKLRPAPRANAAMVCHEGSLIVFGGGDLNSKYNDLWKFDPEGLQWSKLPNSLQTTPESRDGHTLTSFDGRLILFGGIHEITHEKNDISIYYKGHWRTVNEEPCEQEPQTEEQQMSMSLHHKKSEELHNSTQHKNKRTYRQLKELNYNNRSTEHHPITEQKTKNDIRKHHLLKEFEMTPEERQRFRNHSPTLESLKNSISAIGSGNPFKKLTTGEQELKHLRKINEKRRPCARDGHSACLYNNRLVIFGGDRHMMSFNDLFVLDLQLAIEQLDRS